MLFVGLWVALLVAKGLLAWWLPPFVDETFYTWEGRHLAWAYSDLPGLTAWLTRLGLELGGTHPFAMRLPFLLLGAAVPWLVVRLARRWFDNRHAWTAGLLALLMPLSGSIGLLAIPDVPMIVAALICLDGFARLRDRVDAAGVATLAFGLALGALTHYRFVLVLAAGLVGLLCDRRARHLAREPGLWAAIAVGALGWLPLVLWNLEHASAGLRFQFVERHPWAFHADAWTWLPSQFLLVTPALFVLLAWTLIVAWRRRRAAEPGPWGLIAGFATVAVPGYFAMGFFVDSERVNFHWPLAGWLLLIVAAPALASAWSAWGRRTLWGVTALGLVSLLGYFAAASTPALRLALAGTSAHPSYFAGWQEVAAEVRRLTPEPGGRIVADHIDLGAQLAFHLDRPDILVLDHDKNRHSGRAAQLGLWNQQYDGRIGAEPVLLVVGEQATNLEFRLDGYHRLCRLFGGLPTPTVLNVDHGLKRYLLFRIDGPARTDCITPALTFVDQPRGTGTLRPVFEMSGWAFKEGAGLDRIEVTLDGNAVMDAEYGVPRQDVTTFWRKSTDPNHPNVGFRARVDASALAPGRHWLGLLLHGADGSVEATQEMPVDIGR
jgi:hypothetical protein